MNYDSKGIKGYIRNPQNCPFCGMTHKIIVDGVVINDNNEKKRVPDQGYSFCNCRNILFTDWRNIRHDVYDELYFKRYSTPSAYEIVGRYSNYFDDLENVKTFMDVGSINDALLDKASEKWKVYGVDINENILSKHERFTGNIEDSSFFAGLPKVDVVWMSHIFEHLQHPIELADLLRSKINDGGYLFVSMPDPWFIDWRNPYAWDHWVLREHHIMWDMDSFIDMMIDLGYKLVFAKRNSFSKFICNFDYHILFKKNG